MRRNGFTLMEVLMAIFILGIGVIGIAALFPAGIAQQRVSVDNIMGPIVADNAMALLRARLEPGDFGTFEEFGYAQSPALPTVPGDWPWLRPGFCLQDDPSTVTFAGRPYDERGAYDVFSYHFTVGSALNEATEFPSAAGVPFGIPYNWNKYRFNDSDYPEPRFIITQQERYYPMVSTEGAGDRPSQPMYVWDCMFRRYQGRIYVAIFVYRVTTSGGGRTTYVAPPNPLNTAAANPESPDLPPLPYRLDLTGGGGWPWPSAWDASDSPLVNGTVGAGNWDVRDPEVAWEQYAQWLLDQNNSVHRVLSRTPPRAANMAAEVELLRPIQPVSRSFNEAVSYFDRSFPVNSSQYGVENIVTHLWYIPTEVELDVNGDGSPDPGWSVNLAPVYLTVREL
jgi:prepilin-type N-terminal cleavage/methylation domain-containing protein